MASTKIALCQQSYNTILVCALALVLLFYGIYYIIAAAVHSENKKGKKTDPIWYCCIN